MYCISADVSFTKAQIDLFGELTGDNGPVHSIDGIVQGGLILSCLPKFINSALINGNIQHIHLRSVSVILEAKFRNKLPADQLAKIEFKFPNVSGSVLKINWKIYDDSVEYCSGKWVVYKSNI